MRLHELVNDDRLAELELCYRDPGNPEISVDDMTVVENAYPKFLAQFAQDVLVYSVVEGTLILVAKVMAEGGHKLAELVSEDEIFAAQAAMETTTEDRRNAAIRANFPKFTGIFTDSRFGVFSRCVMRIIDDALKAKGVPVETH